MSNLALSTGASAAAGASPASTNSTSSYSKKSSTGDSSARLSWMASAVNDKSAELGRVSRSTSNAVCHGKSVQTRASLTDVLNPFGIGGSGERDLVQLEGSAVISKKAILDLDNGVTSLVDSSVDFFLQSKIEIQLVSVDLKADGKPKLSQVATVKKWIISDLNPLAGDEKFAITFKIPKDFGEIGAFIMRNNHTSEFFLHSLSVEYPDKKKVDFVCKSWVYPDREIQLFQIENHPDRVFFSNKTYLPSETPAGLKSYREQELKELRGDGTGERVTRDRVYDYDVYNDLGNPAKGLPRPVLGGRPDYPYPRRCRTGRPMTKQDPQSESPSGLNLKQVSIDFYTPADEYFGREKTSGFLAAALKGVVHSILPSLENVFDSTPYFDSFKEIMDLYAKGVDLGTAAFSSDPNKPKNPLTLLSNIFNDEGANKSIIHYPLPQVVAADDKAWLQDEELGRQMLAGLNPVTIRRVQEFPPKSILSPEKYGKATSLTNKDLEPFLEGLTVDQAIQQKKLYTVDYHDAYMPYIKDINSLEKEDKKKKNKAYAIRAFFFLNKKGAMMPICMELSVPPIDGKPNSNRVFSPPLREGDSNILWQLAKCHFGAADLTYHEVVSHWLRTHAVMEPFIIATRRQLSALHPIYTLLYPLSKNTMMINAAARLLLINAGGVFESQFLNEKYSIVMSSTEYKNAWQFKNQALPADLLQRGMAEPADKLHPGGVKLLVDDYPFANDGLELWETIKEWVAEYVNIVYKKNDKLVTEDKELQAWWNEIVTKGHGDKKEGWIPCDSIENLVEIICILHWIAGPQHAAINFSQYAYAGFIPNKPAQCVRLIPELGSNEYQEALKDPEKAILSTVSPEGIATQTMLVLELLSTHMDDEEYIGIRDAAWTSHPQIQQAFERYGQKIKNLEQRFVQRNNNPNLINRSGRTKVPYTLLYPHSTSGLTGRGIPNSISI